MIFRTIHHRILWIFYPMNLVKKQLNSVPADNEERNKLKLCISQIFIVAIQISDYIIIKSQQWNAALTSKISTLNEDVSGKIFCDGDHWGRKQWWRQEEYFNGNEMSTWNNIVSTIDFLFKISHIWKKLYVSCLYAQFACLWTAPQWAGWRPVIPPPASGQ